MIVCIHHVFFINLHWKNINDVNKITCCWCKFIKPHILAIYFIFYPQMSVPNYVFSDTFGLLNLALIIIQLLLHIKTSDNIETAAFKTFKTCLEVRRASKQSFSQRFSSHQQICKNRNRFSLWTSIPVTILRTKVLILKRAWSVRLDINNIEVQWRGHSPSHFT